MPMKLIGGKMVSGIMSGMLVMMTWHCSILIAIVRQKWLNPFWEITSTVF